MKKNRLYKNIEEAYCYSPDSISSAVSYIKDMYETADEAEAEEWYSAILSYMMLGDLYDKSFFLEITGRHDRGKYTEITSFYNKTGRNDLLYFLPARYNAEEEAIVLSSVLHIMHTQFPNVHEEAMESVAALKQCVAKLHGINLNLETRVQIDQPDFLTGKSGVPEYIKILIAKKLEFLKSDISWEAGVTWVYSHLDCGDDYTYNNSEKVVITLRAIDEETLKVASSVLKKISTEELAEFKKECESVLAKRKEK